MGYVTAATPVVELFFNIAFTIEMVLKLAAQGVVLVKFAYLRDGWNWLDALVVGGSWLSYGLENANYSIGFSLTPIRSVRVLRPLRTITRIRGMRVLVRSLLHSLPQVNRPRRMGRAMPIPHACIASSPSPTRCRSSRRWRCCSPSCSSVSASEASSSSRPAASSTPAASAPTSPSSRARSPAPPPAATARRQMCRSAARWTMRAACRYGRTRGGPPSPTTTRRSASTVPTTRRRCATRGCRCDGRRHCHRLLLHQHHHSPPPPHCSAPTSGRRRTTTSRPSTSSANPSSRSSTP